METAERLCSSALGIGDYMATDDDRRAAVAIEASLSSYLMTAVLAIIGAQAVIIGLVLDKKEHLTVFTVLSVAAFISLLSSFYYGGRGIAELYKTGYNGNWTIQTTGRKFSKQTFLALAGTVLVLSSVFCGKPTQDDLGKELVSTQNELATIKQRLQAAESDVANLKSVISTRSQQPEGELCREAKRGDKEDRRTKQPKARHPD